MLIMVSKLEGLPVVSPETGILGQIAEGVFDPQNGRLLGFLLKKVFFAGQKAISSSDIIAFDRRAIVARDPQSLVPISDIIRIEEVVKNKIKFRGAHALTESGKSLGKVSDLLIDTGMGFITKYYLHNLLRENKILSADKVIRVDKKGVIFQDDVASPLPGTQGAVA